MVSRLRSVLDRIGRRGAEGPGVSVVVEQQTFSSHGGLWTDRNGADQEIRRRVADGRVPACLAPLLEEWRTKGYVILPGAVPGPVCDTVRGDIERAWTSGDERIYVFPPGSSDPSPLQPGTPTEKMRAVDIYVHLESARQALFNHRLLDFLELIFEDVPLLFQSLTFEKGSQQGMHQDTAYVVVDPPLELAACWIALEDVHEGSGELMYYEGSHRLPEYHFSGKYKHWNPERDGPEQHTEWSALIHENARQLGLPHRTFRPKKGDLLIWSADLAHGGSPVADPELTRRSLVGHWCPARCRPNYYEYRPDRQGTVDCGRGRYSSAWYPI